jgi:hypothetical protein
MIKNIFIFLLSSLLTSCSQHKYLEKITLVETQQSQTKKSLKKILMVGAGSIESRFFLDKLANKIREDLKKEKVQLDYNYLGKISKDSSINKIANNIYDAILVFNPIDTSAIKVNLEDTKIGYNVPSAGNAFVGIKVITRTIKYVQKFDISFYENNSTALWAATLRVTIDYSKNKSYSIISKKIITQMKENNLLLKQ